MGLEMIDVGWLSIVPPVIAIVLALITKEVYSSLFIGLFSGMCIYSFSTGTGLIKAFEYCFRMMYAKIGENGFMMIFLCILWAVVSIVSASGGTQAYGRWAKDKLKTARSTSLATSLLGILVFIDDGFNCLTVGTVMRPIADQNKVAREKLAYILDATAAPVCIIAPVSSWAVAVASYLGDSDGFTSFLKTIPFNLYALLTLVMVFATSALSLDFGPMKKAVDRTKEGKADLSFAASNMTTEVKNGTVLDLVLPILTIVVFGILGMAYVGGFFEGVPFSEAIGWDPVVGLAMGAFLGLLVAMALYVPRKLMGFTEFIDTAVKGISSIAQPILILVFSWSLGGVCREMIGTGIFISNFFNAVQVPLWLLPMMVFIVAAFLSFSTGTSWGAFGILIPIVSMICAGMEGGDALLIPTIAATLSGSVFGDHCSPLSDTTILSSTGAQCEHIRHVETQLPYAILVAAICVPGFLVAGLTQSAIFSLLVSLVLMILVIAGIRAYEKKH